MDSELEKKTLHWETFLEFPVGPLIKRSLNFPYANMKWFVFFDNKGIQRSLSFHNEKNNNKSIENIGPPIIPLESFPYVLLIQLWFVTGFSSFPYR